jgi:CBS domain-containing protein
LSPASFIDADDSIETAGHRMSQIDTNSLFVRDGERTGIITGMNMSKAVVLNRMPIEAPVRSITHFDVISLAPDDFVYSALILMTKATSAGSRFMTAPAMSASLRISVLLGFLAGNAQLVAGRIDRATALPELTIAAREIGEQVRLLRHQGLKIEVIAEIVSDLNRRLFAKLFDIIAPPAIRKGCCLLVMGSEGRGEQTMRTDQDNALILAEPVDERLLDTFRHHFTAALESFGCAPCPGDVMVRNPVWSRHLADYLVHLAGIGDSVGPATATESHLPQ